MKPVLLMQPLLRRQWVRVNNAVVCTNLKNAVTPTGIAMTVAPYILMVAVAGIFAILFLRRRHEEA